MKFTPSDLKWILTFSLCVLSVAQPAIAQEADWSGFYLGAHAGAAQGYGEHDLVGVGSDVRVDQSGLLAGLNSQYLWQVGRFAFGPQGEVSLSKLHGEQSLGTFNHFSSSVNWYGSAGMKAGLAVDNVMVFGTAGVAMANVSGGQRNSFLSRSHVEHQIVTGFSVGLGADLQLQDGWVIGSEYRYYDFSPASMFAGSPSGFQARTVDVNLHSVSLHLRKKL